MKQSENFSSSVEDRWGDDSSRAAGTAQELTVAGVKYRFRWAPAGTFMMGSPESEEYRCDDETLHRVTLSRGYWMMETPVTQLMWRSLTEGNPSAFCEGGEFHSATYGLNDVYWQNSDKVPVESVSWTDVQGFIETLNARDELQAGMRFRLPTEAEWEYACRAWQSYKYSGSDNLMRVGWYYENSCNHRFELGHIQNAGSRQANGWGLFDMSGNVWEWCSDWYDENYYTNVSVTDPRGPNSGSKRVIRGGSFDNDANCCRCASRGCSSPESQSSLVGFRLVLESAK